MQYYDNITKNEILYAYNYLLYMNKYPGMMCLHWYDMTANTFKSRQKFPEIYDFGFLYPDMSIWFTPEKGKEILHINRIIITLSLSIFVPPQHGETLSTDRRSHSVQPRGYCQTSVLQMSAGQDQWFLPTADRKV